VPVALQLAIQVDNVSNSGNDASIQPDAYSSVTAQLFFF